MSEKNAKNIDKKPNFKISLKLLIPYLLREWKLFGLGLFAMLLVSVAKLIDPLILAHVIDVSVPQADTADMLQYAFLFVGVVLLSGFLTWGQIVVLSRLGLRIITELKAKVFQHLMKVPVSFFDQRPVGDLIARVENDSERIRVLFSDLSVRLIGNILFFVGIVIVLSQRSAYMAWGFLIPIIVLSIAFGIFYRVVVRFYRRVREKYSEVTSNLTEYIQGMPVVQVFDRQQKIVEHIDVASGEKQKLETMVGFLEYGVQGFFLFVVNTALLGVVILLLSPKIIDGTFTIGTLIIFTQYIMRITWPLMQLLENFMQMQRSFVSMTRIQELLDLEVEEHHGRDNAIASFEHKIEFKNVWFAYEAEKWVLRDVSFELNKGAQLAFVGPSGSGKTTTINLICGFYAVQKGEILIDGVNINAVDMTKWRRKIGLILQDIYLFPGNVLENVRIYNDEISEQEVKAALDAVEAHKFTSAEQMNKELSERGKNISQGERQLLSFARAVVYNPELVIMDEATSSIDTVTEAKIQHSMDKLLSGKTALIVAHRLSSVLKADCIHYMEEGRIVASGTHSELLSKSEAYRHLVELQLLGSSGETANVKCKK
ncbi:MAG: ABC transporter ATP-binding protein/permease [Candidatus Cloacimonetes bacterium]|nr:ABC transporter ATP-binding protein/permease [Candidatus Cloacimonadota bacterium]